MRIEKSSIPIPSSFPKFDSLSRPSFESTLSSMRENDSYLAWIWKKIVDFFSWLFGCPTKSKEEPPISFFKVHQESGAKYRLIIDGKGSENEISVTQKRAYLEFIRIEDPEKKEEMAQMLIAMMEEEKIERLTTTFFSEGQLLRELGLKAGGECLVNLRRECFIKEILRKAFAKKEVLSEKGKEILLKIYKEILQERCHEILEVAVNYEDLFLLIDELGEKISREAMAQPPLFFTKSD